GAGTTKGSGVPNKDKVGRLTPAQINESGRTKRPDYNAVASAGASRFMKGGAGGLGFSSRRIRTGRITMGKKWTAAAALVEPKPYDLREAVELAKRTAYAKFDETVEMALRLGVDPKRSDQMVRGSAVLPHGTGVKVRILVIAKGEKEKEARDAGADIVGGEELVEKIKGGWLEFDRAIATPDMMGAVGKLGKILGPRGLMPNPKTGTVTFEVAKAISDIRKGRV